MDVLLHSLQLDDQPMDVDIHPGGGLLASGIIDGHLVLHRFSKESAEQVEKIKAHATSCRAVRFSGGDAAEAGANGGAAAGGGSGQAGAMVYTASTDQSILAVDVASGKPQARKKDAHDAAINRLATAGATCLASGDDEGVIKLWDSRQSEAVATLEAHSDYVADLCSYPDKHCLLSVAGDGTLAVIDLRKNKIIAQSEGDADDELLSVAVVKGGKKVVCGSTSGVLDVWSWGYWNDCSDRFPGHPESVTALLAYDEDTVLSGSSDGLIRVLSIQPNKMLGVLGEHADYPIERLAMSRDRAFLASASHDNTVQLWDLAQLGEEDSEEEEEAAGEDDSEAAEEEAEEADEEAEEEEEADVEAVRGAPAAAAAAAGQAESDSDSDEEEEGGGKAGRQAAAAGKKGGKAKAKAKAAANQRPADSDSDDSSSEDERRKEGGKKRRLKGQHRIPSKKQEKRTGGNFFADLL